MHCVDFWCTTLGKACDTDAQIAAGGKENALKALIYPLVQVSLGAIKSVTFLTSANLTHDDPQR